MIKKFISSIQFFTSDLPPDLETVFKDCELIIIKKGQLLLSAGKICSHYYFVNRGALRVYYLHDGKEISNWFAFEDYFFTELESYTLEKPSMFYIEAMEDCEILALNREQMNQLLSYSFGQEYLRKVWEYAFIHLNKVIVSFQTKTAKERYEDLFRYPDFLQRTKQKDLSSMLGVTDSSLSRIRGKKK